MRRFLIWWLLGTQLPALIALWIAQGMASGAAKSEAPGLAVNWPLIAWSGFSVYVLLVLGLCAAGWRCFRRGEDNLTFIFSSLLLPVILPVLAFSFVRFFAIR